MLVHSNIVCLIFETLCGILNLCFGIVCLLRKGHTLRLNGPIVDLLDAVHSNAPAELLFILRPMNVVEEFYPENICEMKLSLEVRLSASCCKDMFLNIVIGKITGAS